MCVVALVYVIMMISGSTFHSLLVILFISDWYFSIFVFIVSRENLPLRYLNSMNCILKLLSGAFEGFDYYCRTLMHMMYGLNLV